MSASVPVKTDFPGLQGDRRQLEYGDDPLIDKIIDLLRQVYDPEIPVNIYDLGLIYDIRIDGLQAHVAMTLTSPNCPVAETLPEQVRSLVASVDEIDEARVELSWNPPWSTDLLSDEVKLELGML